MVTRLRWKSMSRLFSVMAAAPRIPSAPAITGAHTTGRAVLSIVRSPACSRLIVTKDTCAVPVMPSRMIEDNSAGWSPSERASPGEIVEWLAPVSTMNRKGPRPLIITGTTTRPMWSRVVGDANSSASPPRGAIDPGSTASGSTVSKGTAAGEASVGDPPPNSAPSKHTLHHKWWDEGAILLAVLYTHSRTTIRGTESPHTVNATSITEPEARALADAINQVSNSQAPAEALQLVEMALARAPQQPIVLNAAGGHMFRTGNAPRARELYERALVSDGNSKVLWTNLAAACRTLGDFEAESEALEKALALEPRYVLALLQKGD